MPNTKLINLLRAHNVQYAELANVDLDVDPEFCTFIYKNYGFGPINYIKDYQSKDRNKSKENHDKLEKFLKDNNIVAEPYTYARVGDVYTSNIQYLMIQGVQLVTDENGMYSIAKDLANRKFIEIKYGRNPNQYYINESERLKLDMTLLEGYSELLDDIPIDVQYEAEYDTTKRLLDFIDIL